MHAAAGARVTAAAEATATLPDAAANWDNSAHFKAAKAAFIPAAIWPAVRLQGLDRSLAAGSRAALRAQGLP